MGIVYIVVAVLNFVAAACNVTLLILLWRWYGPNAKR